MEDIEIKRRGRPPGSGMAKPEAMEAETVAAQTVNVVVSRDFWNENGERISAGTVIAVPVMAALRGVKAGSFDVIEEA
jgi:pyruvoyl-dependent arginine decarboxylase (PvlArgDC)